MKKKRISKSHTLGEKNTKQSLWERTIRILRKIRREKEQPSRYLVLYLDETTRHKDEEYSPFLEWQTSLVVKKRG
jgi:hypothetical protein